MASTGDNARLENIERALNLLAKSLNNMASKRQTIQLNIIRQKELKNLQDRVSSLETLVASLEAQIASLL